MAGAFQSNAFQHNAFQEANAVVAVTGGAPMRYPDNFPPPFVFQKRPPAPDPRFFTHLIKKKLDEEGDEEFLLVVLSVA